MPELAQFVSMSESLETSWTACTITRLHQDQIEEYQKEAEDNSHVCKELPALQHEKEGEATQPEEVLIKIDDLRQQIALLENQKANTAVGNEQKLDVLMRQKKQELAYSQGELDGSKERRAVFARGSMPCRGNSTLSRSGKRTRAPPRHLIPQA
jgi:hypothetical protein